MSKCNARNEGTDYVTRDTIQEMITELKLVLPDASRVDYAQVHACGVRVRKSLMNIQRKTISLRHHIMNQIRKEDSHAE